MDSLKSAWPGTKRVLWRISWITVAARSTESSATMVDRSGSSNHPSVEKAFATRT